MYFLKYIWLTLVVFKANVVKMIEPAMTPTRVIYPTIVGRKNVSTAAFAEVYLYIPASYYIHRINIIVIIY